MATGMKAVDSSDLNQLATVNKFCSGFKVRTFALNLPDNTILSLVIDVNFFMT